MYYIRKSSEIGAGYSYSYHSIIDTNFEQCSLYPNKNFFLILWLEKMLGKVPKPYITPMTNK